MTLQKIFAKLNFSPDLFRKILTFVWLVFQNENKWVLEEYFYLLENHVDLYQVVTFGINDYL